ncbi:hypothetical protein [Azospirillum brasilense]|uniref:hypothetical protein n=1 Tax=Azospirillum brasilense TaxID=192 RepID=UPI0015C45179|nr:hypothetical protein [Azospirillum brasilense]MDW7595824.1 hypothetical protein [Azospirillum brasilense]
MQGRTEQGRSIQGDGERPPFQVRADGQNETDQPGTVLSAILPQERHPIHDEQRDVPGRCDADGAALV